MELKPCPWCSKQPKYCPDTSYGEETVFCPDENDCPASPSTYGPVGSGDAIAAWNRRAGDLRMLEVTITDDDRVAAACLLHGIKVGGGDGSTFYLSVPTPADAADAFARHRTTAIAERDARIVDVVKALDQAVTNSAIGSSGDVVLRAADWLALHDAIARAALKEIEHG